MLFFYKLYTLLVMLMGVKCAYAELGRRGLDNMVIVYGVRKKVFDGLTVEG